MSGASRSFVAPYASGANDYGALGTGSHRHVTYDLPIRIKMPVGAEAVAAAAADKTEKDPDNIDAIAGDGGVDVESISNLNSAAAAEKEKIKVSQVVVGYAHMLARTEDGRVYSWGCNAHGQLGLGDHKDRATPSLVSYLSGERVVTVAAGHLHSFAVTEAGELYGWGYNRDYQLGLRDILDRVLPTRVGGELEGTRVTSVAGGGFHSLAVTSEGEVFSFGHNRWGQAGVDPKLAELPPEGEEEGQEGGMGEGRHDHDHDHLGHSLAPVASGGVGVTTPTRVILPGSGAGAGAVAAAAVAAGTW